jgi:hypothetical protein
MRIKDDGILDCLLHFAGLGHRIVLCTHDKLLALRAEVCFSAEGEKRDRHYNDSGFRRSCCCLSFHRADLPEEAAAGTAVHFEACTVQGRAESGPLLCAMLIRRRACAR